jgi:hypothetical protein
MLLGKWHLELHGSTSKQSQPNIIAGRRAQVASDMLLL